MTTPSTPASALHPTPEEWLLILATALERGAARDTAPYVARVVRRAFLTLLQDAVAELASDAPGPPSDEERQAARGLLTELLEATSTADGGLAPDIDVIFSSSGDGWLTALWIVLNTVRTPRLWPSDWHEVHALAAGLTRGPDEGLSEWMDRRDAVAARYPLDHRAAAVDRHHRERRLHETLIRLFGTASNAHRWMNQRIPALGGRTPASLWGDGPEGADRVFQVLGAMEWGVYL